MKYLVALFAAVLLAGSAQAQVYQQKTLTGAGDVVQSLSNTGTSALSVQATGAATITGSFQVSNDGTNWISISGLPQPTGSATSSITGDGNWLFCVGGQKNFRVHNTALTGTEVFTVVATPGGCNAAPSGAGNPQQVLPGTANTLDPDISSVTTGGTAVNAFSAGHCKYGCYLFNPANATQNLCGRATGTASGTNSSAGTICAGPGQKLSFAPTASAISAVSSDSSHTFAGQGSN